MRIFGVAILALVAACSSSSTNAPAGGGGTGGATGGTGGGSSGAAGTSGRLKCATDCKQSFSPKEFVQELKLFVCGNSPCEGFCQGLCNDPLPNLDDPCTQCLFDNNVPSQVKSHCENQAIPACIDFAQCLVSCTGP